jgi:Uma2 family endonuclease
MVVEVKIGRKTVDLPYTVRIPDVTEEMFDELVDADTKAELINGVLVMHSPAAINHDDIGGFLRALMRYFASRRKLGRVLGPDSIVHLATCRKFCPDTFFVRRGRLRRPRPKEFDGAPDQVTEVLSPSNRTDDLIGKRPAYQEARVGEIWWVDPDNREVIVDRPGRRGYTEEVVKRGILQSQVLTGFWIDVAWLWADPLPDDLECLEKILASQE